MNKVFLRRFWHSKICLLGFGLIGAVLLNWQANQNSIADEPAVQKPLVTISTETTRITAPLKPSGYPDYLAALNQAMSKGVTPENNAVVLLLRMGGPKLIEGPAEEIYRRLQIEPLPEHGDYLVDMRTYLHSHPDYVKFKLYQFNADGLDKIVDAMKERLDTARLRPWKDTENPLAAEWIDSQAAALSQFAQIHKFDHWYNPLISSAEGPYKKSPSINVSQSMRNLASLQAAKTMRQIGNGEYTAAAQSIKESIHICALYRKHPFAISYRLNRQFIEQMVDKPLSFLLTTVPANALDMDLLEREYLSLDPIGVLTKKSILMSVMRRSRRFVISRNTVTTGRIMSRRSMTFSRRFHSPSESRLILISCSKT